MAEAPMIRVIRASRLAVTALSAIGLVLCAQVDGRAWAREWSGVELAWRNDPRPAADAPVPVVEPPSSRRTTRRSLRRSQRRIEVEANPILTPGIPPHGLPSGGPTARAMPPEALREFVPPLLEPQVVEPAATVVPTVVHRGQAYGSEPAQRFDLHLPDGCSGGGLPLIVWIHGPDWRTGSRSDCPVTWLAEQGFAVATIDYRSSDDAVFPAQLDDCRAALRAICAEATTWGIDPSRICVAGMGGGGHLAALVAFTAADRRSIREASADQVSAEDDVAAVALFDAPTHLTSLGAAHDRAGSAESRLVGGPLPEFREAAQKASPLLHVSADDPPTLIVQGSRGDGVAVDQGERLDAALRAAGVESALVLLDAKAASLAPLRGTPAGGAFVEFLDRALGPTTAGIED